MDDIRAFWWKVLEALSTIAGLAVLAFAHLALDSILGLTLRGQWESYHQWVGAITFGVFYAVYFFLLIDILELFWPEWLRRRPAASRITNDAAS